MQYIENVLNKSIQQSNNPLHSDFTPRAMKSKDKDICETVQPRREATVQGIHSANQEGSEHDQFTKSDSKSKNMEQNMDNKTMSPSVSAQNIEGINFNINLEDREANT